MESVSKSEIIIENKKEWDKQNWCELITKENKEVFIYAAKEYYSEKYNTDITVFFMPDCVFVWCDENKNCWKSDELKQWLKDFYNCTFPNMYTNYRPIIEGTKKCSLVVLKEFGLENYIDDIVERYKDIEPYGYEEEIEVHI